MDCEELWDKLSATAVQEFIKENLKSDINKLILKGSPFPQIPARCLAEQIRAKRKAEKKLPTWFNSSSVLFPPVLNLSQSSSEVTAKYKAQLVGGGELIDITGGFGVDDYYFSSGIKQVYHCEQNSTLSRLAQHNYSNLPFRGEIKFMHSDGIAFVRQRKQKVDWIYADPDRRNHRGERVFRLEDCAPNIVEYLGLLLEKAENILIKTSPLLDLKAGIIQFKTVRAIHVVAVKNEVKEILWIVGDKPADPIPIYAVALASGSTPLVFEGTFEDEEKIEVQYADKVGKYLYEPNTAILKAGLFKSVSQRFGLYKLASNTHLYTGEQWIDFPGRRFEIESVWEVHNRVLKKLHIKKANITVRNYPLSVRQIRRKYGIEEGGERYLFFALDTDGRKILMITHKP